MKKKNILLFAAVGALVPTVAKAHCPLCTAGAGVLAIAAASFGVSTMAIGVFIGAFAVALGLWMARLVKKQYVKYQQHIIMVLTFLATIFPMMPLITEYMSFNLYWFGTYGSVFNRTYVVHGFLVGSFIGAMLMLLGPYISVWVKRMRKGKLFPYQGIFITLALLVLTSLFIQFGL